MSAEQIRVVALEPDGPSADALREHIGTDEHLRLIGTVGDLPALLLEVARQRPHIIVIALDGNRAVQRSVKEVLELAPDACVVVSSRETDPALVSRAVTAGARGFVVKPYDRGELLSTLREAFANLLDLRRRQQGDRVEGSERRGQIIAVYSPKGGVGCTTIATNVAVALRARTKKAVAIVDLDLQFGDVGVALDLRAANSITELVSHSDAVDAALIDDVFAKHFSGISALLAPETIESVEGLEPERVIQVIEQLRKHFDYVICDLWSTLDELSVGILRCADRILLVSTPELPSLKNLRRVIAATTPLLLDERTLVIVNRHPSKASLRLPDIERNLGRTIAATIPSEGIGVTQAINEGITLFDARARTRSAGSYKHLAELVVDGPPKPAAVRVARPARSA